MKYNLLLISTLLLIVSCTRNVDLQEVFEEKIVIEGNISKDSIAQVRISKTVNSTEPDIFPRVENATVVLRTGNEEEVLTEVSRGIYQTALLKGVEGETYQLSVKTADSNFEAIAKIPILSIDLLELFLLETEDTFDFTSHILNVNFQKNGNDSLYCQFNIFRNETKLPVPVFYKSEIPVSQNLSLNLTNFTALVAGEVLKVEVVQMQKWQYDYLLSVQEKNETETISGLLIGPPDNLEGNVDNGGLGYFGATTVACLELVIP